MSLKIYNNGRINNIEDVELAERISGLSDKKDPWSVIDELMHVWAAKAPDEVKALCVQVEDQRAIMSDPIYGQTEGGKDLERRLTVMFPYQLQQLIRTQYKADELPFDSNFFRTFAKRYPYFAVAQKV